MSDLKNDAFERLLIEAFKNNLHSSKDIYSYANVTLDSLFINDRYESSDGTCYYFEIPACDTWHKRSVVVKL
jgi:hypothetical protein